VEVLEQVLQLYREKYFDFNVQHFDESCRTSTASSGAIGGENSAAGSGPGGPGKLTGI
jgi:hypothetical protein